MRRAEPLGHRVEHARVVGLVEDLVIHRLETVSSNDLRRCTCEEFAATAPLNLVYVVDQSKQPGDFDARRNNIQRKMDKSLARDDKDTSTNF